MERQTSPQVDGDLYRTIYGELRKIAGRLLSGPQPHCTLTPTEVVHEAYVKLCPSTEPAWSGRTHFVACAALAMRQILVDHARRKLTDKRGGKLQRVALSSNDLGTPARELEVLAVNDALEAMAELNPRTARVVDLRVFGGLTVAETAEVLGISKRTAEQDWKFARLWLSDRLQA